MVQINIETWSIKFLQPQISLRALEKWYVRYSAVTKKEI